jgi:hypothetical protein
LIIQPDVILDQNKRAIESRVQKFKLWLKSAEYVILMANIDEANEILPITVMLI